MTTEEFRDRIRKLLGVPDITGAKHAHPCLVRQPGDRGYRSTQTEPTKETEEQNHEPHDSKTTARRVSPL